MSTETQPLILITNDDGVSSPGLLAAVQCVIDLGEIWVAAPRLQQSGLGRGFPSNSTMQVWESTLEVQGMEVPCLALDGSPAQVVRHAVLRFLPRLPDLTISGINYGENVGGAVTISGTIGAAIEAASFDIPTLAASLETAREHHFSHSSEVDFGTAAIVVRRFAEHLLGHGMPDGVDILKIDVPSDARPNTPWRITRTSRQPYFINPITVDEQGRKNLLPYIREIDFDRLEPDSDAQALIVDRVISVTPLTTDLTAKVNLQQLQTTLLLEDTPCRDGIPNPHRGQSARKIAARNL
jgi:5'-nucleotidase